MMAEAVFADETSPPTTEELLAAVGPARGLWLRLDGWARDTYGIVGEPLFFGRDSGWSVRYRRSGKALFTLIPREGAMAALVVIGPSLWAAVADLPLSISTRAVWDAARSYPDGRWLWLEVGDDAVAHDVGLLVSLKSPPPRRKRKVATPATGAASQ
jgi:hypothetical protein